jgi:hypothetical protein
MPLDRLLTGHGDPVTDHRRLVTRRLAEHRRRCRRILAALEEGPANAYGVAGHLWSARTVREQPLLVVWEVLGHLDLLLDAGAVSEEVRDDGSRYGKARFALREPATHPPDPRTPDATVTGPLISYPGGQRSAESN